MKHLISSLSVGYRPVHLFFAQDRNLQSDDIRYYMDKTRTPENELYPAHF